MINKNQVLLGDLYTGKGILKVKNKNSIKKYLDRSEQ